MRVLAIADSDSYLKWSWATLQAMPSSWHTEQIVIGNPIAPSAEQSLAATGGAVETLGLAKLIMKIRRDRPGLILLACTGPVVEVLANSLLWQGSKRPLLVTGLPGISVPATAKAIKTRAGADLFLLHSKREVRDFTELAGDLGSGSRFALATLPFASGAKEKCTDDGTAVVLAAQAKVPSERDQRRAILLGLAGLPAPLRARVKLRATPGEEQTHREAWPYPELWAGLVAEGAVRADAIEFAGGSMAEALREACGLVTVSSTAALEAVSLGLPTLILSDFGVSAEQINVVFEGSGLLGTLDDLRAGRLFAPDPDWLDDNYFHQVSANDWLVAIEALLAQRAAGSPPRKGSRAILARPGQARGWLRLVLPPALLQRLARLRKR